MKRRSFIGASLAGIASLFIPKEVLSEQKQLQIEGITGDSYPPTEPLYTENGPQIRMLDGTLVPHTNPWHAYDPVVRPVTRISVAMADAEVTLNLRPTQRATLTIIDDLEEVSYSTEVENFTLNMRPPAQPRTAYVGFAENGEVYTLKNGDYVALFPEKYRQDNAREATTYEIRNGWWADSDTN